MYIFSFEGKAFTPDGSTSTDNVDARNKETEQREIEHLKTHPDKLFLYVNLNTKSINTWMGTKVNSGFALFGSQVPTGGIAGPYSYKRSVRCEIFGQHYHGWYYESAGDYCRLTKFKR